MALIIPTFPNSPIVGVAIEQGNGQPVPAEWLLLLTPAGKTLLWSCVATVPGAHQYPGYTQEWGIHKQCTHGGQTSTPKESCTAFTLTLCPP